MFLSIKARVHPVFGCNVSKSNRRTNRSFQVNYQNYEYQLSTGDKIKLRANRAVYRTINKYGSFERYIIHCRNIHPDLQSVRSRILKRIYG